LNHQKRASWLFVLGALVLLLGCAAVVCLAGGVVVWRAWQRPPNLADVLREVDLPMQPTPSFNPVNTPPTALEEETASTVLSLEHPTRDLVELAGRLGDAQQDIPRVVQPTGLVRQVGDRDQFWVHDEESAIDFTVSATLVYVTDHAYWWVQDGYEVPLSDLKGSAERFETQTYPTNHYYFGTEWSPGIDGDVHLHIFNGNVPGVAGYFSAADEYSALINPYSNEREMFYIHLENAMPGDAYYDGILAHEFQHMIHWYTDGNEDTWVNEGMSELAAQLNGYDVGDSALLFSLQPDTQLTTWPEPQYSGPHYGASYLFMAYFLDRFGQDMLRSVVAHPANGIEGFNLVLEEAGAPERFDDVFADWVIANYVDSDEMEEGRYDYPSLRIDQMRTAALHEDYPVRGQSTVRQYAADYIGLMRSGATGTLEITFAGATKVSLLGVAPASGQYHWWSGRGDDLDTTLTRAFDLSGLSEATLRFKLWHEIEVDYDYAYVQVSTDEGAHWAILPAAYTTTRNPNVASFGPAYTGNSGGGQRGTWIDAEADLSPYVGQAVLIRFEYVTDEALNLPGMCLDDIEIPELAYAYDAETGDGGWEARGWARVGADVPQRFVVQLVTLGDQPAVRQVLLDAKQAGSLTLGGFGRQTDWAVLVVAALAPVTTEGASYQYSVAVR
jgi:immune inhibitor A